MLDADDRVLLVHFVFPDRSFWSTPGGGIEPGETREVAIRRELCEEVGLVDVELGPVIWERTHLFEFAGFSGQYEQIFMVRAPANVGQPSFSAQELLAEGLTESRWWSLDEIEEASDEVFSPIRLGPLLSTLLESGPPNEIVDTGV